MHPEQELSETDAVLVLGLTESLLDKLTDDSPAAVLFRELVAAAGPDLDLDSITRGLDAVSGALRDWLAAKSSGDCGQTGGGPVPRCP